MVANCIKVSHEVYTPQNGDPIPMVVAFLDIEGFSDVVKVHVSEQKVQGTAQAGSQVYVDFHPRYGTGGRIVWKPSLLRFT